MKVLKLFLLIVANIALTLAGTVYKVNIDSGLNVRKEPSNSSPIVGSLKKNDYIFVTNISNGWAKYYMGYCNFQHLEKVTIDPKYITTGSLNFSVGPSPTYGIITTLSGNTIVTYYGRDPINNDWGITDKGYCLMSLNLLVPMNSTSSPSVQPTITNSNNVIENYTVLLKQYNYPKEYVSGCTIKKYGSCITSITMALNRAERKNYTPYDIAKKMTFNKCGAYHSSFNSLGFTIINDPSLEIILNALRAGRIVPYGSKNIKGNQHWVAVYGYIGDYKTLKCTDFLIYDPSYSKTRLSEHLSTFPIPFLALVYN
ncbi:hypothetical protein PIROE2DRAFT_64729 [Piromyces sp. E2]|nr:hypothetical protein PIROE2DRAFT_64729 [Piromyces sp. E2]|eukprot:OUM57922.1 hypothetical protein PIROE2DRAFT_64729 [Piromyces sp. E2]